MTSVFKQAATQSRNQSLTQLHLTIASTPYKASKPELELKSGKNKSESRHSSKTTTNSGKVTASMISSNQLYQLLYLSSTFISTHKRSRHSKINTGWNLEI